MLYKTCMSALSKHIECNKGGHKLRSAFKGIPFNFEHMNLMSKSLQNITAKTTDKEPIRVTDTGVSKLYKAVCMV